MQTRKLDRFKSVLWGSALALSFVFSQARAADPALIQQLVSQVSTAKLEDHVQALEYPRSSVANQAQASAYIKNELESYGYTVFFDPVGTSENVVARLQGTSSLDRRFILGAHFDTVVGSPGADDNGSGVAGMLEIARLLANRQPEFTIEFIGFAFEEVGKLGSQQYADELAQSGVDVIGMISFDMIGYTCSTPGCQLPFFDIPDCVTVDPEGASDGNAIVIGANVPSSSLANAFLAARDSYVPTLSTIRFDVEGVGLCFTQSRRSDQAAFWDQGFSAMALADGAETRNPNYHAPGDVESTINYLFSQKVVQATMAMIVELTFPAVVAEQPNLVLQMDGDLISWAPVQAAVSYDVLRGRLSRLRLSSGNFRIAVETCIANDTSSTGVVTQLLPVPDDGYWFLARPVGPGGPFSYNTGTEIESRDDEINSAFLSCP